MMFRNEVCLHISEVSALIGVEVSTEEVPIEVEPVSNNRLEEEYDDDDENDGDVSAVNHEKKAQIVSYSSIEEVIPQDLDWPIPALLRLYHLASATGLTSKTADVMLLQCLCDRMQVISTDDLFISEGYIHEEDVDKYRAWSESKSSEVLYFRPNFDIEITFETIQTALDKLFHINKNETFDAFIGYYTPTPRNADSDRPSSGTLLRSRRTGRANPYIKALVEEKKQHSRKSSNV